MDTTGWDPGDYLFRLDAPRRPALRTPDRAHPVQRGRVVIVNAVTTWQAYNQWGGYSLYKGPDGQRPDRARAVRSTAPTSPPMRGAGQFLQFELGAVRVAEQAGIPLGYATDVDLHADPHLLDGARAMITLGHDEYWSTAMRAPPPPPATAGSTWPSSAATRSTGTSASPTPRSARTDWRSTTSPSTRTPTARPTRWRPPRTGGCPHPRPESALVGNTYKCFPGRADLVVADPANWMLHGIVHPGQHYPASSASSTPVSTSTRPRPGPSRCSSTPPSSAAPPTNTTSPTPSTTPPPAAQACSKAAPKTGCAAWTPIAPDQPNRPRRTDPRRDQHPAVHHLRRRPGRARAPAADNLARLGIKPGTHRCRPRPR